MRFRTGFTTCLAVAAMFLVANGTARAGGEARTHDGFFLRLSTGFGAANADISDATGSLEISGTSGDLNIAVGGMVAPNLAVHGTLWGWAMSDPDGKLTISGFGSGSGTLNGDLTMGAIGAGVTYFIMPANFYLSGSLGMGSLDGTKDMDGKTKAGLALDGTIGKEWWVGDAWGLGLNGGISYFSSEDDTIVGIKENWSGPAFALRFSATFN